MIASCTRAAGPVVSCLLALATGPLAAQTVPAPTIPPVGAAPVGRVHLERRQGSLTVGMALALPVGSAADPEGGAGTAQLTAAAVARQVEADLASDGGQATITVDVTRGRTSFSLVVLPETWERAWRALARRVFTAPLEDAAVQAVIAAHREVLQFEADAPLREVQLASSALLFGEDSPWARPVDGSLETLERMDRSLLDDFRRAHYLRGKAALALVGEVDSAPPSLLTSGPPLARAPSGASGALPSGGAWSVPDRVRVVRDVTNTWITFAYPVPPGVSPTLLEFLAHRLEEDLNPSPSDPGLFSAHVSLRSHPAGRILLVEVAVLPESADRWEGRVPEALNALRVPAPADFFRWQRRRFRAVVLLREALPERAALRHAEDLLQEGAVRAADSDLWSMDAAALAELAARLGPPRTLVFGPDLSAGVRRGRERRVTLSAPPSECTFADHSRD